MSNDKPKKDAKDQSGIADQMVGTDSTNEVEESTATTQAKARLKAKLSRVLDNLRRPGSAEPDRSVGPKK